LPDKELEAKCSAAMNAFGAPFQLKMLEIDAVGLYDTQAESMNKVFVTTELGGGGTTSPETIEIATRGVDNFLIHAGILKGKVASLYEDSINLEMPDDSCFLFSEQKGLLEPFINLGDRVKKGDLMARIRNIENMSLAPHDYFAPRDGMVISRHYSSLVQMGDCINVIAEVV